MCLTITFSLMLSIMHLGHHICHKCTSKDDVPSEFFMLGVDLVYIAISNAKEDVGDDCFPRDALFLTKTFIRSLARGVFTKLVHCVF